MAPAQIFSNNIQPPKLCTVGTVTDYRRNVSQLTQYLSKQPADETQWEIALRQLKIYSSNNQTWSFIAPLIRELAKILPVTAQHDCVLASKEGRELLQVAKRFEGPEAGRLVDDISFKIAKSDRMLALKVEAWNLFQTCRFPELVEKETVLTDTTLLPVTRQQLRDGGQAVRLYLEAGDVQSADRVLEHLRLAVFHYFLTENAQSARPLLLNQVRYLYARNNNGVSVQFPLADVLADDMSFNTLESLVVSMKASPIYSN